MGSVSWPDLDPAAPAQLILEGGRRVGEGAETAGEPPESRKAGRTHSAAQAVYYATRCEILAADLRRALLMRADRRAGELTRDLKAARLAQLRAEVGA